MFFFSLIRVFIDASFTNPFFIHVKTMENNNTNAEKCLIDSATTHSILSNKSYFTHIKPINTNLNTIAGTVNMVEGQEKLA